MRTNLGAERMLECSLGHRWRSTAADTSIVRCGTCSTATRVGPAVRRAAGNTSPPRPRTIPTPAVGAAPRPIALTPDPPPSGSLAAARAAAFRALTAPPTDVDDDDQDDDDQDDDDQDDDEEADDLDNRSSLAATVAELTRAFMPSAPRSKQPQKPPAARARPEVPPRLPEPFSGRLAGRMGTRGGNARPAPTVHTIDAAMRSDNRHFVRAFNALGFTTVPAKKRAPNSCPIQVGGRECPSFGRLVGIYWPDIPDLRKPAAVCISCAYNIQQRAISEADSQSEIPEIYR